MKPRVFRDPVHGLIGFQAEDAALGHLVDTRAVQRLRRVRQLGFASLVYPGAEHSRFGHALGSYHIAGRVAARLDLPPEIARAVKVAALLHDIGHGPFSHAWEEALGGTSHEAWGRRILAEDGELHEALARVAPELPDAVGRVLDKTYVPHYACKLVSSQLDADRMDYLLRDAHFTGVGYSAFDLPWVIHALHLAPVRGGEDPTDLVVDHRRGVNALQQYLFGRFHMYAQVYYHKTVRAAEWMFLALMRRFVELARRGEEPPGLPEVGRMARAEAVTIDDYLALDDALVQTAVARWARSPVDPVVNDLAARLVARRLFKTIELADGRAAAALRPALEEEARAALGDDAGSYWTIDRAAWLGYDPRDGEEIFVVGHPGLGTVDLARLFRELPLGRTDFAVRVVCAPELRERFARVVAGATRA